MGTYLNLPSQYFPLPRYPEMQVQPKEPSAFVQDALEWQELVPSAHSSISKSYEGKYLRQFRNLLVLIYASISEQQI